MMIKQINDEHEDKVANLLFAVIKEKERIIVKETELFCKIFKYRNIDTYLNANSKNFNNFTFINKGDIDERTTRD